MFGLGKKRATARATAPSDPRFTIHNITVQPLEPSYKNPVRQLTHGTKYVRYVNGLPFIMRHNRRRRGL